MTLEKRSKQLWENEYTNLRGLDLTYKQEVPEAVHLFHERILLMEARKGTVLDIGCGKGRIAMHLANLGYRVVAFDFVLPALNQCLSLIKDLGLTEKISLFQHDINNKWPLRENSIETLFAITVIDNLISKDQRIHFKDEAFRVLKPGGLVVIENYLKNDGYYGEILKSSPDRKKGIVMDPNNQISFKIYSTKEITKLMEDKFKIIKKREYSFKSIKYRKPYIRSSCIMIFQKSC